MIIRKYPKVSVLMSVYNGERYLYEVIQSILDQTWQDYEFLIINDGSTDNSHEIIQSFTDPRIRLVDNLTNIGLTKSLNRGLGLANGIFIARQDADDISHPTRLEQQVQFLDTHPNIALLGTQARIIDRQGNLIRLTNLPLTDTLIKWHLMFNNAFVHTSVMFRRDMIWEQLQGYDERLARTQDLELWGRVAQTYKVRNLAQSLVDSHRHPESITAGKDLIRGIIPRNLKRLSGFHEIPPRWDSLIHSFRTRTIKEPNQLVAVIDTLFSKFYILHPDAAVEQDMRSYLANQLGLVAYYSAPYNRLASIKIFMQACRMDTGMIKRGIAREVPIAKYFALWFGGEFIRRMYRR